MDKVLSFKEVQSRHIELLVKLARKALSESQRDILIHLRECGNGWRKPDGYARRTLVSLAELGLVSCSGDPQVWQLTPNGEYLVGVLLNEK